MGKHKKLWSFKSLWYYMYMYDQIFPLDFLDVFYIEFYERIKKTHDCKIQRCDLHMTCKNGLVISYSFQPLLKVHVR